MTHDASPRPPQEPTVELLDVIRARGPRLALATAAVILAGMLGAVTAVVAATRYQATAVVMIPVVGPDSVGSVPATENFLQLVKRHDVVKAAANDADITARAYRRSVTAAQRGRGNLAAVRAVSDTPAEAERITAAAVRAAFDALYGVEVDAAETALDHAMERTSSLGPDSPPEQAAEAAASVIQARNRVEQVEARVEASKNQSAIVSSAALKPSPLRRSQAAMAVAVVLVGFALMVLEWVAPPARRLIAASEAGPRPASAWVR